MSITIALNLLPAIKRLNAMEKGVQKFLETWGTWGKVPGLSQQQSSIDLAIQRKWKAYISAVAQIEDNVAGAAQVLFTRIVERTSRHTNRAAGSWAISWNDQSLESDLGFLAPGDGGGEITFYSGKKDWYPEAPVTEHGTKVLGVHDWGLILTRHHDMVNNVIHNFSFSRSWGQRNSKGQMMAHKTIFIYNTCPYIEAMENGAFSESPSGNMVALSIAEVVARLEAGGQFPKRVRFE